LLEFTGLAIIYRLLCACMYDIGHSVPPMQKTFLCESTGTCIRELCDWLHVAQQWSVTNDDRNLTTITACNKLCDL